ncbi:cuticle collagen 1-like isoform X2 [Meles meles]|nr:cuticle collagen 1-like isoform X2 [Meles meles]
MWVRNPDFHPCGQTRSQSLKTPSRRDASSQERWPGPGHRHSRHVCYYHCHAPRPGRPAASSCAPLSKLLDSRMPLGPQGGFPHDAESGITNYNPPAPLSPRGNARLLGTDGTQAMERGPACPKFRILSPDIQASVWKRRCLRSAWARTPGQTVSGRPSVCAGWLASVPALDRPPWAGVLRPGPSLVGAEWGQGPAGVPGEAEAPGCPGPACPLPSRLAREGRICGTPCQVLCEGVTGDGTRRVWSSVSAGVETTQRCPWDVKRACFDLSFVFIKCKRTESPGIVFQRPWEYRSQCGTVFSTNT